MKLPYIKWYFRDAAADLRLLDAVPRCVWYEMLWLMAASDRYGYLEWAGHPMTDLEIARASGLAAEEIAAARPILLSAGIPSVEPETGAWFCRRMVDDEKRRVSLSEAGKKGGGNPLLASSPEATELDLDIRTQNPSKRKGTFKGTFKGGFKGMEGFDQFWEAWPRKDGKEAARKAWPKAAAELPAILAALEWQRASDQWQQMQYIPLPASYLNGRRWEDDPAGYKRATQIPKSSVTDSMLARGSDINVYKAMVEGGNRD